MKNTTIKLLLIKVLGERITSYIHGFRFALMLKFNKKKDVEFDHLSKYVKYGDTVIDVGANGGDWTSILSEHVGGNGKVYAFEADKYYYCATKFCLKLIGCENVNIVNIALGERKEQGYLNIYDESERVSGKSYINKVKSEFNIEINLDKMDSLIDINDNTNISLIKIDVEGYEMYVIRGAKQIIKEFKPVIILEIGHFEKHGYDDIIFYNELIELGYSVNYINKKNQLKSIHHLRESDDCLSDNRVLIYNQ